MAVASSMGAGARRSMAELVRRFDAHKPRTAFGWMVWSCVGFALLTIGSAVLCTALFMLAGLSLVALMATSALSVFLGAWLGLSATLAFFATMSISSFTLFIYACYLASTLTGRITSFGLTWVARHIPVEQPAALVRHMRSTMSLSASPARPAPTSAAAAAAPVRSASTDSTAKKAAAPADALPMEAKSAAAVQHDAVATITPTTTTTAPSQPLKQQQAAPTIKATPSVIEPTSQAMPNPWKVQQSDVQQDLLPGLGAFATPANSVALKSFALDEAPAMSAGLWHRSLGGPYTGPGSVILHEAHQQQVMAA